MASFAADCSVDKKDRLTIELHGDSASVCIIYDGRFSQVILSEEDVLRLLEFVKEGSL